MKINYSSPKTKITQNSEKIWMPSEKLFIYFKKGPKIASPKHILSINCYLFQIKLFMAEVNIHFAHRIGSVIFTCY